MMSKPCEGYGDKYSLDEFKHLLNNNGADMSTLEIKYGGWIFGNNNATIVHEKIKLILNEIRSNRCRYSFLVQFWAPKVVPGGSCCLTTSYQPFALSGDGLYKGLCWWRKTCMEHVYYVGEGANEEEVGPPGRVFRNWHPESSPDLRLYSITEHPLRDQAVGCGLKGYMALPVFDLSRAQCLGVLELLVLDCFYGCSGDNFRLLEAAVKRVDLRSTHVKDYKNFVYKKPVPEEIGEMLELAIDAIPQLHLAQVWMPCQQCGDTMSCMERVDFINSADMKFGSSKFCDGMMLNFLKASEFQRILSKTVVVGRATDKSCFFRSLCDVSICEYPLAHYAQQARLSSCFTICLQSTCDVNDLFIVEFFLQSHSREEAYPFSTLQLLLQIMKKKLTSFKITSEEEQLKELSIGLCMKNCPASFESNRKHCMDHQYFVDDGAKEEELGPLGRVFRNRCTESTPNFRLYSTEEFPHRDYAIQCGLRTYLALPIFNLHKSECLGVLEWIDFEDAKKEEPHTRLIRNALEVANLESPYFRETQNINQNSALHELAEMLRKVIEISQLSFVAQVWVPGSQCTDTNKNLACVKLELVESCHAYGGDWFMCKSHKVETGKGITGILLSSENKSCFFPNLCHFSITEEPQAHLLQVARFNVCFAICLQSSYTSNNLYILQFLLGQASRKYEHLCSFLSFLLRMMKETLKSFRVASGKQLGEELVVEVISLDKNDEFTSFELHQPDVLPVRFVVTQYVDKEPRCQHSTSQLVHDTPNRYDSSVLVPEAEPDDAASTDSEGGVMVIAKKTKGERKTTSFEIRYEDLELHFGKRLEDVAKELGADGVVLIKAKFGEDNVKVQLLLSSGIEKLKEEVGKRFNLMNRSFKLYYFDEDEWFLLACDDDLQLCMKTSAASGRTPIQILGAKEEEVGPPGRVFKNGYPESSPNLRLYSTKEHPLRDLTASCGLRRHVALPVSGVLEFLILDDGISRII
ncbi:UNVERIFIED_CONTAM: protein NLP7 [Sesamum calycinum]|uniref:Protein NLP7 n=1 Tax=Sesamum calycinum TaxID=2727403 RepID=A0AAW2RTJ9_9LAMI